MTFDLQKYRSTEFDLHVAAVQYATAQDDQSLEDLDHSARAYGDLVNTYNKLVEPTPPPPPPPPPPTYPVLPTKDLPGWTWVHGEDFTTPVELGGFVADQKGILLPAGAAGYSAYGPGRPGGDVLRLYPDGWSDSFGTGWYAPSQTASVRTDVEGANGVFDIWLHHGTPAGKTQARGMGAAFWIPIPKLNKPWLIGPYLRAEYRIRSFGFNVSLGSRYGAVPLLIAPNNWPAGGEIDAPEGDIASREVQHGFYHRADPKGSQERFEAPAGTFWGDWHTWAIEWSPKMVRILCDGRSVGEFTTMVPQVPLAFVIQSATYAPGPAPTTEGHLQVDYVSFWTWNG